MTTVVNTMKVLADEVKKRLDKGYDLVYVAYDDKLSDSQAAMIVRGDLEGLWDDTSEWESDQQWQNSAEVADDVAKDVISDWESEKDEDLDEVFDDWESSTERTDIMDLIQERDTSDWPRQLVRHTGDVLLRICVVDEDNAWSFEQIKPTDLLKRFGLKRTKRNLELARSLINESSPEYHVRMGYALVGVDLEAIYDLPDYTEEIDIVDPHLYLCNPFMGDGWVEGPFEGTIRVKREDLRTDSDAFGYGWGDVVGGTSPSYFEAEIIPVTPNPRFGEIKGATFLGSWEHKSVSTKGIESLGHYELWVRTDKDEDTTRLMTRTPAGEVQEFTVTEVREGLSSPAPWTLEWRVILNRYENWKKWQK